MRWYMHTIHKPPSTGNKDNGVLIHKILDTLIIHVCNPKKGTACLTLSYLLYCSLFNKKRIYKKRKIPV